MTKTMIHTKSTLRLTLLLSMLIAFCFGNDKPITSFSFCPQYTPQAQFAGYYIAKEKGFYADKNLKVIINTYDCNGCVTRGLEDGCLDIGTYFLSSALKLRSEGMPLVNIGQVSHQSALILLAKKSSGIKTPDDINDKKIGLYLDDFNHLYHAFLENKKIQAEIIPVFSGIQLFLAGGTDLTSVMWYNEYHTIINSGYNVDELTPFFLKDYGYDIPEDGIYCLEETWEKNPQACQDFVDASIEGWIYAFNHPEEALDIVIKYMKKAHIPANKAHQKWMLSVMKKVIFPDGNLQPNITLSEDTFDKAVKILSENEFITKPIIYQDFHKTMDNYAK